MTRLLIGQAEGPNCRSARRSTRKRRSLSASSRWNSTSRRIRWIRSARPGRRRSGNWSGWIARSTPKFGCCCGWAASAAAKAAQPSQTAEPAETAPSPAPAEAGEMAPAPPAACPSARASPHRGGEESFRSNPNQALESIVKPGIQAALCTPATGWDHPSAPHTARWR